MKAKAILVLMLALSLVFCVAACGEGSEGGDASGVNGEVYDAGNISALVPDGWLAIPATDLFDEYDGDYNPNALQICKGADDELDMFTNPYVRIDYYADASSFYSAKDWYDDVVDIEPFTLGL